MVRSVEHEGGMVRSVERDARPRVVVIEGGQSHDVLEVIEHANNLIRARTRFLFEVGEELSVRIEAGDEVTVAIARVRGHVGDGDGHITELELADVSEPRKLVTG
jgi:hypothetical protein